MSAIEIDDDETPRFQVTEKGASTVLQIHLAEAVNRIVDGQLLSLYVTGWSDPWPCYLGLDGYIHATCPTSSKVQPRVMYAGELADQERHEQPKQ